MKLSYTPKLYECTCCRRMKPESEFYRESYTNKRTNQCKDCINIKRKVQRARAKHGKFISKEKQRAMTDVAPEYELKDWRDAMIHFKGACAFCGKPEGRGRRDKLDRDHLVAISQGGQTTRCNIVPACPRCNRGRGNRLWQEWYPEQDSYSMEREIRLVEWQEQNDQ